MVTVFSRAWFALQQPRLLGLANHPCTKGLMRQVLGLEHDAPLIGLTPYEATFAEGTRRVTEFHNAHAFGLRLYHRVQPLWELLHWFDMKVANPLQQPVWNFGFDTLISYPDADPEPLGGTFDGNVQNWPENPTSWSTLRNAANGTTKQDADTYGVLVSVWPKEVDGVQYYQRISRSMFLFGVGATIAPADTVTAATFAIYGYYKAANHTTLDQALYTVSTASDTGASLADYGNFGSVALCATKSYDAFDDSGYNTYVLNEAGIAHVDGNSIVRLGMKNVTHDAGNSAPSGDAGSQLGNTLLGYFVDDTSAANGKDPYLLVTYPPASTFVPRLRWW